MTKPRPENPPPEDPRAENPPGAARPPQVSVTSKTSQDARRDARQQRLATALRANLRRRKAQAAEQATTIDSLPATKPQPR